MVGAVVVALGAVPARTCRAVDSGARVVSGLARRMFAS